MMSLPAEQRRTYRTKVMLSATIEQGGQSFPIRVVNLSGDGALVVGPALAQGSSVRFRRDGKDVGAEVAWARGNASGLSFDRPLNVQSLLRKIPNTRTAVQACVRRPGFKASPLSEAECNLLGTSTTRGATALDAESL